MQVREAKDFIIQQTAEQAAIENAPLSDLEKRMMYFTETGECPEDPIALNDAFEAEYDTDQYEAKISKLMHHARLRIRQDNPETCRQWDDAIRTLRKGDHYLLVFWNQGPQERPPYDSLKLLGTAILVIILGTAVIVGLLFLSDHYHFHWKSGPDVHRSAPGWLEPLFLFIVVSGYLYYVVLPWLLKRPPQGLGRLFLKFVTGLLKNRDQK